MIPDKAHALFTAFSAANGWEQRMRLLMDIGQTLEPLTTEEQNPQHEITGCESKVWLVAKQQQGAWFFKAYSDTRILRGLLALILARINGLSTQQLQTVELDDWLIELGLAKQLSSSRRDGIKAIIERIKVLSC